MYYVVLYSHQLVVSFSPKVNCSNILSVVAKLLGMDYDKSTDTKLLAIHRVIWDKTNYQKYNYEIVRRLPESTESFTKIFIMREPLDRALSGLLYSVTYGNKGRPQQTLIDFFITHFNKNHHLGRQVNDADLKIGWDHVFDISQFEEFIVAVETVTGIKIDRPTLNSKHWNKYNDKPTGNYKLVKDVRDCKNLSRRITDYFTADEIATIREMLKTDLEFYHSKIKG